MAQQLQGPAPNRLSALALPLKELKPKSRDIGPFFQRKDLRIGAEFEFYLPRSKMAERQYKRKLFPVFLKHLLSSSPALVCARYRNPWNSRWKVYTTEVSYLPFFTKGSLYIPPGDGIRTIPQLIGALRQNVSGVDSVVRQKGLRVIAEEVKENTTDADLASALFVLPDFLTQEVEAAAPLVVGPAPRVARIFRGELEVSYFLFPFNQDFTFYVREFETGGLTIIPEPRTRVLPYLLEVGPEVVSPEAVKAATRYLTKVLRVPLDRPLLEPPKGVVPPLPPVGVARPKSWEVKTDRTLKRYGLELVSPPLPVGAFFKSLSKVLGYIRSYGYTDQTCGLHIGISTENVQEVNLLKLFILLEEVPFLKNFPERVNSKWARGARAILREALQGALQRMSSRGTSLEDLSRTEVRRQLEKEFRWQLRKIPQKQVGVNTLKLVISEKPYIEFRYLGGSGYENKGEEIKGAIAYFMKALLSSLPGSTEGDSEFLRALHKVVRELALPEKPSKKRH